MRATLKAVKTQKERDSRGLFVLGTVGKIEPGRKVVIPPEEEYQYAGAMAWDDATGCGIDPCRLRRARREDVA